MLILARLIQLLALSTIGIAILCSGCRGNDDKDKNKQNVKPIKIAIIKWATHPALDEVEGSFIQELTLRSKSNQALQSIAFEQRNANASPEKAKSSAEAVSRSGVAMIVAFGTPASQAVARTRSEIPFLFAAVSDPNGARLLPSSRTTGIINVDYNIVLSSLRLIKKLVPNAKTIGTLYNPSEQNSTYVQKMMLRACAESDVNLKLVQRELSDPTKMSALAENLLNEVDAVYCANDNAVNLGVSALSAIAKAKRKLFLIGELSALSKGPAAAMGVNYTETGRTLAHMAEKILAQQKDIKDLPTCTAPAPEVWLNLPVLSQIGITVPNDVKSAAGRILGE